MFWSRTPGKSQGTPPVLHDGASNFAQIRLNSQIYKLPWGSRKKSSFLSGPATKAFSPPPSRLGGHRNFLPYIKKVFFSLVAHPFSPPAPLSGRATQKITFFAASLVNGGFQRYTVYRNTIIPFRGIAVKKIKVWNTGINRLYRYNFFLSPWKL